MDGIHDLGGKQGYGPVRYALDATAFHSPWEVRVNALYAHAVRSGIFNMDEYRHAIERMDPRHYLTASYYERSLTGLATLCVEKGVLTREELERRANGVFPAFVAERRRPRQRRRTGSASSPATACA
jgi:nitrile hydratase